MILRILFCQINGKRTALYDLTSFCCQCARLRITFSFGAKKIRTKVQLQISEKIRTLLIRPSFFQSVASRSSRLKIKNLSWTCFWRSANFFCPRKFQSIPQRGQKPFYAPSIFTRYFLYFHSSMSENTSCRFIKIQTRLLQNYFDSIVNTLRCTLHIMIDFRKNLGNDSERSLRRE